MAATCSRSRHCRSSHLLLVHTCMLRACVWGVPTQLVHRPCASIFAVLGCCLLCSTLLCFACPPRPAPPRPASCLVEPQALSAASICPPAQQLQALASSNGMGNAPGMVTAAGGGGMAGGGMAGGMGGGGVGGAGAMGGMCGAGNMCARLHRTRTAALFTRYLSPPPDTRAHVRAHIMLTLPSPVAS